MATDYLAEGRRLGVTGEPHILGGLCIDGCSRCRTYRDRVRAELAIERAAIASVKHFREGVSNLADAFVTITAVPDPGTPVCPEVPEPKVRVGRLLYTAERIAGILVALDPINTGKVYVAKLNLADALVTITAKIEKAV
jgi:hypothetical protein